MKCKDSIRFTLILVLGCMHTGFSQVYVSGTVFNTGNAYCAADLNNAGVFVNKTSGVLYVTGNISNSGTTAYDGGTLVFNGTSAQTLGGSTVFYTSNLLLNNAAGISLSKCVSVNGTATFSSGVLATTSGSVEPLEFTAPASPAGTSDASHVNGYVRKLGTGLFTYPVGDAVMYQPVLVNAVSNAGGLAVKYTSANAGTAPYGTAGSDPVLLQYYNALENWSIVPVSSASGNVMVFWDTYDNQGINAPSDLRVAHLTGGQWLNEGTTGLGTMTTGSVTSNVLNTWGVFTLGSISSNSPLPTELTSFDASSTGCEASVKWHVAAEPNFDHYELQSSTNAMAFAPVVSIPAKGSNSTYTYQYNPQAEGMVYYRLKMVGSDNTDTYSGIVSANISCAGGSDMTVYPVPAHDVLTINAGNHQAVSYSMYDMQGHLVETNPASGVISQVSLNGKQPGVYSLFVQLNDGSTRTFKIVKTHE